MDQALHGAAGALPALRRVTDFPFTEARRREMVVWATDDGRTTAYVKGAPETVANAPCASAGVSTGTCAATAAPESTLARPAGVALSGAA